ncbi:MAG TPA: ABC transporter permease subunit [Streptosporangiaceae bacterium]|jgi:ABC-2 type transport system permease protein|nr:ABC transporter permease subunit [Streptosporangiaceae bacterium]
MAAVTAGLTRPGAVPVLGVRAGIAGTLRSEFTKIGSVRSTYWSLILLVLAGFAWTVADCLGTARNWPHMAAQDKIGFDATQTSVTGLALLGQLVILVLGTLVLTSEYSTGMIRTSLTVMPRRAVFYWSKAAVFAAVSVVIALATSVAVFLVGQSLLHSTGESASLSQPGALRAVLLTAFFVSLSGAMAYGLGAIVRNTAGGITSSFGLVFLLPQLAKALPTAWYADVDRWLPGGDLLPAVTSSQSQLLNPHMFSACGEFAVFCGYTIVLLIIGALLFSRRDA